MEPRRRVIYGVHGYGRGHAVRAQAVLPELTRRHDVLVLAGDEAADQLAAFAPGPLPTLRYVHDSNNRRSPWLTFRRNGPLLADLVLGGPALRQARETIRRFDPHVIISDSEIFTHHAGAELGLPRISFDHYGVLAWCDLEMSPADRAICRLESLFYRFLVRRPARAIATAFFPGRPTRSGVRIIPPVLREIVRRAQPTRGEHLLVYLSNAETHFTPPLRQALSSLGCPVRVYGPRCVGPQGPLDVRPLSVEGFVADLASCRAVFATAGNQLISEALHFGKPMLLLPEASLEQRLNARYVERWGIGSGVRAHELTPQRLAEFVQRADELAPRVAAYRRDGLAEAMQALEQAIAELAP